MTDLATLGLRVESQEVATADQRLDELTAASARAEKGVDRLADAARRADSATGTMNVAVREQTRMMGAAQNAMGLTANESLNLSRQFADVGVTLAMGMNPAMVALQQGPQLMDIFAMSAARAGTTIRTAMLTAATGVYALMAPFLPMIAIVAAAGAAIGGTFALATRAADQEIGKLTDGMGLTQAQMDRLKEKSVDTGVTMGDVFRGTGTTIKEMFQEVFGDQLKWVSDQWKSFLDFASKVALGAVAGIGAGFIGTYNVIRNNWRAIPAVIGDAAISAANIAIRAVETLVNVGVAGLNRLINGAKALSAVNPAFSLANAIGTVDEVSFGGLANPFAGAASSFIGSAGNEYVAAFEQTIAAMESIWSRTLANIEASGQARVGKGAGDAGSSGGADDEAVKKAREVVEILQQLPNINLQPLNVALISVVDPLRLIADEMRLIDGLAQETAQGLASAFGETGRALGDLLTTMSGFQSRMAEINLAEKDHQITAMQAERERAYATIANYGDMLGAAKGFFQEGSDGYRFLQAAEAAYRVFQFAMSVQAMTQTAAETAASVAGVGIEVGAVTAAEAAKTAITVAGTAIRTPLKVAEGAAGIFATLGPFAFPVVAAMIALLATLGMKGGGGKGGGGGGSTGGTSASVSRSQGFNAQQDQARTSMFSSLAQKVEVKVTADREGIHAYVAGVAEDTARPMIVQGVAAGSGATRAQVAQDIDPTYRRGRG